jgi:hypothetical protein
LPEEKPPASNESSPDKAYRLRAQLGNGTIRKDSSEEESSEEEESTLDDSNKARPREEELDYSSGVESDNDLDLLVEQEVI